MPDADLIEQRCSGCGGRNRLPRARTTEAPRCARCKTPLFPDAPLNLGEASFDAALSGSAVPVLVDFWAPWCGPCRSMEPVLARAARERSGRLIVAKVNIDENPGLARRFSVRSIPALKLFIGGSPTGTLDGAVPASTLARFLDQHAA